MREAVMPRARKSPTKTPKTGDAKSRLIAAAMELAAAKGWRNLGLGEIARAADVPLDEAYATFRTKAGLLAGFTRQVNEAVLAGGEAAGTPREKLFELLMRRFDALKAHRTALKAIARDSIGDPTALCGIPIGLNAMAWMLEAAGISAEGWRGRARCLALAGAYAATLRTFLGDDSDDLSKTMATLDRRLKSGPFGAGEAK
ncbi:MAG TPA: TetR family transcriptional regulator, partial [Stellaceae bacterium]